MVCHLKRFLILIIIAAFSAILTCCEFNLDKNLSKITSASLTSDYKPNPNLLTIHYIDVGQGDCELIQIDNKNMLIDAGPKDAEYKVTSYLKSHGVLSLDFVIITHPHEDHIGGMNMVLDNFKVNAIVMPKIINMTSTNTYREIIQNIINKKIPTIKAQAGNSLNLSSEISCNILAPNNPYYEDLNNYSIVMKIIYKNCKFLFMGDAQSESENEMLYNGFDLNCNVIKIGHHGSKTSSSNNFLKEVSPNIAIISAGKNNDFGHPHKITLDKLNNIKCKIYRTDLQGDIIIESNGIEISVT